MKIAEKIKKYLNRNNPESIVDNVADLYQERKENGEKDPMDNTAEEIIQILKTHPDIKRAILSNILENDNIPDKIFEKVATQISKDEEIPDSVISDVVEKTDINVPDETINKIIEDGDVDPKARIDLLKNVDDKDILKSRVKNEFIILYKRCYLKKDSEVVDRIKEIEEVLEPGDIDNEIENIIEKVVARKMAENYYSDLSKGTNIYTLSQVISAEKMVEIDMASKVENEFRKIEEERKEKEGRYNKEQFKKQILEEIGKQIGIKYEETGVFVVPQSENMKKINEDEIKAFINSIQVYAKRKLTIDEITDIDEQVRGTSSNVQIKENTIINLIKKLPKNEKTKKIDTLTDILQDEKSFETIHELKESGLFDLLKQMPENKKAKTIQIIKNAVTKREKYNVSKKSPKIKSAKIVER